MNQMEERKRILQEVQSELERLNTRSVEVYRKRRNKNTPALSAIYRNWDSWSELIEELGYVPTHRRITKDQLVNSIKKQKETLGRVPKAREIENVSAMYRYFGTYSSAIKEIFGVNRAANSYASVEQVRSTVVSQLESFYRSEGRYPTHKEWNTLNMKPTMVTLSKWGLSYREIVDSLKQKRELTLF